MKRKHLDITRNTIYNNCIMRTTLNIDDDLLLTARSIAAAKSSSIGVVISELARKGLERSTTRKNINGFPVFPVPAGAQPITLEDVKKLEDDV